MDQINFQGAFYSFFFVSEFSQYMYYTMYCRKTLVNKIRNANSEIIQPIPQPPSKSQLRRLQQQSSFSLTSFFDFSIILHCNKVKYIFLGWILIRVLLFESVSCVHKKCKCLFWFQFHPCFIHGIPPINLNLIFDFL